MLELRAGLQDGGPYTSSQVARILHISGSRESQLERAGLLQLQSAVSGGRCGSVATVSTLLTVLGISSQDHLVAVSPALARLAVSDASGSGLAVPGAAPGAPQGPTAVAAVSASRNGSRTGPVIQNARLSIGSTPLGVWILAIIATIAGLTFLSATGRYLAERGHQPAEASASAAESAPPAPAAPAAPKAPPAPAATAAPQTPPAPAEPAFQPAVPAAAPSARPAPTGRRSPQQWLSTHRSQIGLALTVAGGAMRVMARARKRR